MKKRSKNFTSLSQGFAHELPVLTKQKYPYISICLDFSQSDIKAITHGVSQGNDDTIFYLIHVVESATARATGAETRDFETLEDWKNLQAYAAKLRNQGYKVEERLGFGNPRTRIPEIVNNVESSLLVIGSHGHEGLEDIIYGETIQAVRHKVKCPVLIV